MTKWFDYLSWWDNGYLDPESRPETVTEFFQSEFHRQPETVAEFFESEFGRPYPESEETK